MKRVFRVRSSCSTRSMLRCTRLTKQSFHSTQYQNQHRKNSSSSSQQSNWFGSSVLLGSAIFIASCSDKPIDEDHFGVGNISNDIENDKHSAEFDEHWKKIAGATRDDLPQFTLEDLESHNSADKRIWVAYKNGVYDITEWIELHPGGSEKIIAAAGKSIEPFWQMYGQHIQGWVLEILESYRIGNIDSSLLKNKLADDPYALDPERDERLIVHAAKPFNAEPPAELLDEFITPNELFYVRNHLPVPLIDMGEYALKIEAPDGSVHQFTLTELKEKFEEQNIIAAVQCAGNRRSGLHAVKPVKGGMWDAAAIGNAEWSGVKLVDVLKAVGTASTVTDAHKAGVYHVHFVGLDQDESGVPYAASVPADIALAESNDALLAFTMNGEPLPRDHGAPLRVIVPGVAGARQVKWLSRVKLAADESDSHWQKKRL
mmetsp:Transcript_20263/g.34600  ORF Transcript_20263/g.34600 Transcript_20263/m.34600 type:complete len:430 (-) Transcript_20263:441-1730(-)